MQIIESEKKLEILINKLVKEDLGGWPLKMLPTFVRGLPDRIFLLPGGRVFFAEIKTTKATAKKIQVYIHKKLRGLGFDVYVLDTSEQIRKIVKSYV